MVERLEKSFSFFKIQQQESELIGGNVRERISSRIISRAMKDRPIYAPDNRFPLSRKTWWHGHVHTASRVHRSPRYSNKGRNENTRLNEKSLREIGPSYLSVTLATARESLHKHIFVLGYSHYTYRFLLAFRAAEEKNFWNLLHFKIETK